MGWECPLIRIIFWLWIFPVRSTQPPLRRPCLRHMLRDWSLNTAHSSRHYSLVLAMSEQAITLRVPFIRQNLGLFLYIYFLVCKICLCGLVVRVPGYRSGGTGFDSRHYQIFWVVVGLERGPLTISLVSITEDLLEWKSSGFGSRKPCLTTLWICCGDHVTPSIRKSWY
jgi:hypothetical protein